MSFQNKILTYMIEHLGLPLMNAVGSVQKKSSGPEQDAEVMAKMLTSSVDLGIAISGKMDIPSDANRAEALRFRLTALAAEALSDRARLKNKEPTEADMDSLKATTDSLFVFSSHFTVDEKGIEYLEQAGLKDYLSKELSELTVVEALLPVIAVIDHKDRGIFPNIAERLIKESEELSKKFLTEAEKPAEFSVFVKQKILQLLSDTFVRIYPRVIGSSKPIGDVWQEFDRQKALVVLLMDYLLTGQKNIEVAEEKDDSEAGTASGDVNTVAPPAVEPQDSAAPQQPQQNTEQAPSQPLQQEPVVPPPPPQGTAPPVEEANPATQVDETSKQKKDEKADQSDGGNPLSFFKK